MKTLIAVPCMDQVAAPFAQSLATLKTVGDCVYDFNIGSLIYDARNRLTTDAIKCGADFILWFDSDMIIPQDAMVKLMAHMEQGKDIVSGLYFRRRAPFTPVLYSLIDRGAHEDLKTYPENTTFEVDGCGFGCVMTRVEAMQDILFNSHDLFTPFEAYGEDLSFCLRAKDNGYKIWCDSTIKCGHIGQVVVDETIWKTSIREA